MMNQFINSATPGGVIPGGVRKIPKIIDELWLVAGICDPVPTIMFVTSTKWNKIAKAVKKVQRRNVDGTPTPDNFQDLKVGCLTVVNSGTADEEVVNILNIPFAEAADFQKKRAALVSGRA